MAWLDWLLVAIALGSITVLIIFYGPTCGPFPDCTTVRYFPEAFAVLALAAGATVLFGLRRMSKR